MGTEAQALSAGYPLMRYGLAEYNAVIDYQPKTENAKSVPETYRFIASNIKGCYVSWSRSLPSGEVRIGDDIYLSIPNGWDERLCYYPWYTGHRYWQYNQWDYPEQNYENSSITPKGARNNESVYRYYHGNETNLDVYINRNRFTDKLLVKYDNVREYAGVDLLDIADLSYTPPPTNKNTHVRLKLEIVNVDTIAVFDIKYYGPSSITFMYDFGDGNKKVINQDSPEFSYDKYVYNIYSIPGTYIVDISLCSFSADNEIYLYTLGNFGLSSNIVPDSGGTFLTNSDILSSVYISSPYKLFRYVFEQIVFLQNKRYLDPCLNINAINKRLKYLFISIPNDYFYLSCYGVDYVYVTLGNNYSYNDCYLLCGVDFNSECHISETVNKCAVSAVSKIYFYSLNGVKFYRNNVTYEFPPHNWSGLNVYIKPKALKNTLLFNPGINVSLF